MPSGWYTLNHKIANALPNFTQKNVSPLSFTLVLSSWYHRPLIYDVKRITKIDGMGPFKATVYSLFIDNACK